MDKYYGVRLIDPFYDSWGMDKYQGCEDYQF